MRYAARLLPVGLLSLSALVACTDQLDAPTASLHASPPLDSRAPLRDAEIDRTDTHFGARVLVTTERHDGTALRSAGDPMLTASEDEVYLEGGYGSDGRMRFSVYFESAAESPRIGAVRLVGNELQTFDRAGVRTRTQLVNDAMAMAGLPGGDFAMAYFASEPPTCPAGAPECVMAAASLQAEGSAQASVGAPNDVRVMRVRPRVGRSAANADDVEIEQRFRRVRRAPSDTLPAWRLEETRQTHRARVNGRDEVTTTVTRMSYRAWNRHDGKERGRKDVRDARRAMQVSLSAAEAAATVAAPAPGASSILARPVTGDAEIFSELCRQGSATRDEFRPVTNGRHMVYQHGFCSNASVFFSFDTRLAQAIQIQRSQAYSLVSTDHIESQANDLRRRIVSKRPERYTFVGHSQGGLVVRRLAQLNPEMVDGVITIGTPHLGAHLATWGPEAAEEHLSRVIRRDCFNDVICRWVEQIIEDFTNGMLLFGRDGGAPALQDLRPGSQFLERLNSTFEPFPRVSIEVSVGRRWALARMVGDSRSAQERILRGERPGGDARVTEVEDIYGTASFLRHFSAIAIFTAWARSSGISCSRLYYAMTWPSCSNPSWDFNAPWNTTLIMYLTYDAAGRIMEIMNGIDRTWDELTTRRADETDGLIHLSSQRYPAVPGTFKPQRVAVNPAFADSHAGQTKSPGVFHSMLESLARIDGRTW